jgi:hypothetical protein
MDRWVVPSQRPDDVTSRRRWPVRALAYLGGFLLPDQPQSIARLLALGLGGTACYVAVAHPHEYQTIVGLATIAAGFYATRTTGSNGSTRPWWAKLPAQETVDEAKTIIRTVAQQIPPAPVVDGGH